MPATLPKTAASVVPVVETSAGGSPVRLMNASASVPTSGWSSAMSYPSEDRPAYRTSAEPGWSRVASATTSSMRAFSARHLLARVQSDAVVRDADARHGRGPVAAADRADIQVDRMREQVERRRRGHVQLGLQTAQRLDHREALLDGVRGVLTLRRHGRARP